MLVPPKAELAAGAGAWLPPLDSRILHKKMQRSGLNCMGEEGCQKTLSSRPPSIGASLTARLMTAFIIRMAE